MLPSTPGVSLEWLLWIAFSRHPIEECFRQGKNELGMDHFEVRGWGAIHRHFYISQLSLLFCSRVRQELQLKKNAGERVPHRRDGTGGGLDGGGGVRIATVSSQENVPTNRREDRLPSPPQSESPPGPYQAEAQAPSRHGRRRPNIALLRPGRFIVGPMADD